MVLRLILFCLFYAGLIGGGATVAYYGGRRLLRAPLERWKHKRLGKRNAHLLESRDAEICFICLAPTHPDSDVYETSKGWYHAACFDKLLND